MSALLDKIAGRRVVASVSGGKDSAALSLWLTEQGIDHERVHMLTGWDSEITMDYIHGELPRAIGPIVEIRGDLLMPDLVRKKGMFPSKQRRYCTDLLKMQPLQRYISKLATDGVDCPAGCDGDDEGMIATVGESCSTCGGPGKVFYEVVSAVGIRAGESKARAAMTEWEWSDGLDCEVWRPLLAWTVEDVIAIHQRHGLAPNPLYLKGAERVGCWPCIMARKSEIKLIADTDPARIDRLRHLEAEVTERAREIVVARSETLDHPRTWFQQAIGGKGTWGIDRAVEWSRTTRGGKKEDRQEELFAGMNDGCMRWGLCETAEEDDPRPTPKGTP